nr:immunoglobulin light chain junction region [Macaca mulatta]MOW40950.1 immunoglobulin light chain junction region [Macaca mulatta]
CQQHYDYPFTF